MNYRTWQWLCVASVLAWGSTTQGQEKVRVYVGTYSQGKSEGIYRFDLDLKTGTPGELTLAAKSANPSFLAVHPSGKFLFAANEISKFNDKSSGAVSAFAIEASGDLTLLNQQSSEGTGPCHISLDKMGKNLLVANYGGGSVACLPVAEDGKLSAASSAIQHEGTGGAPGKKTGPHAHSINLDAANRFAMAADLGLDKILVYRFDPAQGKLTANDPPFAELTAGSGPRHFAFHPSGKFAYVINERTLTVTAFGYNADKGELSTLQTISTVPEGTTGNHSTAEVQVHPSGKFLYGSNRGPDSIVAYTIDGETGRLTLVEQEPTGGKTPRNFGIDPTGQYLLAANQSTHNIVLFKIDQTTGALTPTGKEISVPIPVCVKFLPLP